MKRILFGRIILPIVALLVSVTAISAQTIRHIKLVTGNDYLPYTDQSLPQGGMHTEIVRRALEDQGVTMSLQFIPWKRGYVETRDHRFDATFPYSRTDEREKEFTYSDPFFDVENRAFVLKGSELTAVQGNKLGGRVMCSPIGYATPGWVGDAITDGEITLESPPDMEHCFRMLEGARVDFVHTTVEQGWGTAIQVLGDRDLVRMLDGVFYTAQNHLIVARDHPQAEEIIRLFNAGLRNLRRNGVLAEVIRRHREGFFHRGS